MNHGIGVVVETAAWKFERKEMKEAKIMVGRKEQKKKLTLMIAKDRKKNQADFGKSLQEQTSYPDSVTAVLHTRLDLASAPAEVLFLIELLP